MVGDEIQTNTDTADRQARRRRIRDDYRQNKEDGKARTEKPPKKMHGAGFLIIVLFAAGKDMFDILAAVSVVFAWISFLVGPIMSFIIFFYLWYVGVSFTSKKVGMLATMFLIEFLPFLSIMPMTVLSLFVIRYLENSGQVQKFSAAFDPALHIMR
ncbi:MAG: hypothetical protein COW88_02165 [Candidatus Lloydbacteria bacterium CG22_combo_CG10-13_8_21_14_all_47_15]|uniref:Uncharacterized protein n=1 Tax=Candidatus Lloydbacteria bacterium CG22_combo_CG10-13_8_21_14_all_47_15 TaxID=1974635 RepID=A0A2H0CUI0_9BACT|nr:MAG: hypothetical protein COW88_02165 [Candidatus Lloydbacteria bacterium CG22_combo_CG10-13_8_21_14_all_47_15]